MTDNRENRPARQRCANGRLYEQELTTIESEWVYRMREMIKQLVLARACRARGDSASYAACLAEAHDSADSLKREIDEVFEIYRVEIRGDNS